MQGKATDANAAKRFDMPLRHGKTASTSRASWYAVRVPLGSESGEAERLRRLLPEDALTDAFVLRKERWCKRNGAWSLQTQVMYPEYVIAESEDGAALSRALRKLSGKTQLAGRGEHGAAAFDADVQRWLRANSDSDHVVRASEGRIDDGRLTVCSGPLVGQERRIAKIDRHKRACIVALGQAGERMITEMLALNVPEKN